MRTHTNVSSERSRVDLAQRALESGIYLCPALAFLSCQEPGESENAVDVAI